MQGRTLVRPHLFGHGRLAYVQIPAHDVQASAAFYRDIFGWQIRGGSQRHLSFTDTTGDMIGAFVTGRTIAADAGAVLYIYVHGLDAALERMQAAGASSSSRRILKAISGSRRCAIPRATKSAYGSKDHDRPSGF
jgi:predicted enzyme related to lactoylglutathione lyase